MTKVEFIESYIKVGNDYQWHDNHGKLIRCKDCKYCRTYYHGENMPFSYACDKLYLTSNLSSDDYCSRGVRKEKKNEV